ncbi:MAG: hypothetical protein LUD79_04660 [Oscillospiraceae bacterium]|nr:hypothetical protein [Oscillospiraceae bacterium]
MIEQYIYTRSDSAGANRSFGHGVAYSTEGIAGAVKTDVSNISRYSGDTVDATGAYVKVLEKRNLPNCNSQAAIQQSVLFPGRNRAAAELPEDDESRLYLSTTVRPQFLTHGYVCDLYGSAGTMLNPDLWFYPDFIDYNVNLKPPVLEQMEDLPHRATPLRPLAAVLKDVGFSLDQFVSMVRTCFDTENEATILLIEVDYTRPDARELGAQLLRWIFHLLPFGMRRQADFSTCYDLNCGGNEYCLALVPASMVVEVRGRLTINRAPTSVRYGYLYARGAYAHNKMAGSAEFDAQGSSYGLWLGQVIRTIYEQPPETQQETLRVLDEIYTYFDGFMKTQPAKQQTKTEFYDVLCRLYHAGQGYQGPKIPEADQVVNEVKGKNQSLVETLLELEDKTVLRPLNAWLLKRACQGVKKGYSVTWMKLLCRICTEVQQSKWDKCLMDSFLARLLDGEKPEEQLEEYFALRGLEEDSPERFAALERVFFCEELLESDKNNWKLSGADSSAEAGLRRANAWLDALMDENSDWSSFLEQQEEIFLTLGNFTPAHMAALLGVLPAERPQGANLADISLACIKKQRLESYFVESSQLCERISNYYQEEIRAMLHAEGSADNGLMARLDNEEITVIDALDELLNVFGGENQSLEGGKLWRQYVRYVIEAARDDKNRMGDRPELHQQIVEHIRALYKNGQNPEELNVLYRQAASYMVNGKYTGRSLQWYQDFSSVMDTVPLEVLPDNQREGDDILKFPVCMAEFLRRNPQDYMAYTQLRASFNGRDMPGHALQELYRLFKRNESRELAPDLLAYYACFLAKSGLEPEKVRARYAKVYLQILNRWGGDELAALLDQFATAEQVPQGWGEEPPVRDTGGKGGFALKKLIPIKASREPEPPRPPRAGAHKWMVTDAMLLDSLGQSLQDTAVYRNEMVRNEMFAPRLARAIYDLSPRGTVLNGRAVKLCCQVQEIWASLETKPAPAKKEMHELKKQGVFDGA